MTFRGYGYMLASKSGTGVSPRFKKGCIPDADDKAVVIVHMQERNVLWDFSEPSIRHALGQEQSQHL